MKLLRVVSVAFIISLAFAASCKDEPKEAQCIDKSKITEGPCTMEYVPVCGCDGKTYGNACQAEHAGLLSWELGGCKES